MIAWPSADRVEGAIYVDAGTRLNHFSKMLETDEGTEETCNIHKWRNYAIYKFKSN